MQENKMRQLKPYLTTLIQEQLKKPIFFVTLTYAGRARWRVSCFDKFDTFYMSTYNEQTDTLTPPRRARFWGEY